MPETTFLKKLKSIDIYWLRIYCAMAGKTGQCSASNYQYNIQPLSQITEYMYHQLGLNCYYLKIAFSVSLIRYLVTALNNGYSSAMFH
jgi:hypothetical protein